MKLTSVYPLLLIILLAFFLRVYKSGTYALYLDEKYTLVLSQGIVMEGANQKDVFFEPGKTYFTPKEFWKEKTFNDFIEANIRGDIGNSPVYYGVFWVWLKLFGFSDFSVRFLSVLFSTMVVGMLYIFVRRHLRSEALALLSAFIAAIEPFFVAYSHMARNYSMSFFLTLLATHIFLLLLERIRENKPTARMYAYYGLLFAVSLLSHYLTVTVFLCHGLYVLLFLRPVKTWLPLLLTALVSVGIVSLWFIFGGGKYTFQTLSYQAQLYRGLAQTHPYDNEFAIILPATFANVTVKSLPLWADLLILSNGLGQIDTLGIRNMFIALLLGVGAAWTLHYAIRRNNQSLWLPFLFGTLLVVGMPFYTVPRLQYIVLAALPTFLYLLVRFLQRETLPEQRPLLYFLAILATVPTMFLILMAFKNNHTYGLTQRYSGFSFPYSIIFVAMMLRQMWTLPTLYRSILIAILVLQSYFVVGLLVRIYEDRDPKYTYFTTPRRSNPYILIAERIKTHYTPGDTILYPAIKLSPRDSIEKTHYPYSVMDAQLTNIYLPKKAEYWQRLDTTQTNKVILIKGDSGRRRILFDFQGNKFRY
jgi:4-amino-4-deoxy-L-arabinose transferase-like glycosyltransferase